ncbi:tetratricopeptide repeat protein [Nonomuraea sp. NPDC050227]|uniref:tetratricopeptide repeat protein n=1 Tax=Nonomuraea sp. NPDC050227 TaxID=3364360 RepID=UPI0037A3F349
MSSPRRVLCGAVDIKGWSGRPVPEQIRAQQSLVTVVYAACRAAGLPEEIVQSSGDGVLIMPPSDIDETAVVPELVHGLTVALRQENRLLSEGARIRLRLSLTNGVVSTGPTGFSGPAIIECFRLLDSPAVKSVLVDHPAAELAVVVSDHLYQDVIRHGFRSLRPEEFWRVDGTIPERGFSATAWVWVSERAQAGVPGAARTAGADGVASLEELLRAEPAPSPSTLLRLGRAQLDAGEAEAARLTYTYLIERAPREATAYLELGRLERLAGRPAAARHYFATGAGLLDDGGLLSRLVRELLELSA